MGNRATAVYSFEDIIGISDSINICKEKALRASKTSSPILIYGETGTGKEVFVQAIHNSSSRKFKPFIAQNCGAIPDTLLEGILFGTVKGSFTGADERKGLFELAHEGTLYLDELNSMPMYLQGKILRVLQEGVIRRVGDIETVKVDVRVIASMNENPEILIAEGKLRRDLYYRLNVVRIQLPSLLERKVDVPVLVNHFINKFNSFFNCSITGMEQDALERLFLWNWEGNIRELEHVIEGVFNYKQKGTITLMDLEESGFFKNRKRISLKEKMLEVEKGYIIETLIICNYNISKASELLMIPRQTLQSKMKKLNIG